MAAQNGKLEVCETLLKMKADSNATDIVSLIIIGLQFIKQVTFAKHALLDICTFLTFWAFLHHGWAPNHRYTRQV